MRRIADGGGPINRRVCDLIRARHTTDQTPASGQARRDLNEDGGKKSGHREAMTEARVHIPSNANGESAKSVCDLGVGWEANGGEVVDDVTKEGDYDHDGHILPLALVDDNQAESEGRYEHEGVPGRHSAFACDVGGGMPINASVEWSADGDAVAKEKGVNNGIDHPNRARDDVTGLKLEWAAHWERSM